MAGCNPFKEEIQNGIRLSCLLIEVGTQVVRKIFDSLVKPNLQAQLTKQKTEMRKYRKGSKSNPAYPKLLNADQFDQLYGKCYGSEKFDLTLLILLIQILCKEPPPVASGNWYKPPLTNDLSRSADLVRLRIIRNTIYGHISTIGYEDGAFEQEWKKLVEVLIRLGADADAVTRWKECPLDGGKCAEYLERHALLIINDTIAAQEFMETLEKSVNEQTSILKENKDDIKELKEKCSVIQNMISDLTSDSAKTCIVKLNDLMKKLDPIMVVKELMQFWGVVAETLSEEFTSTHSKLDQIAEKQEQMMDCLSEGKEGKKIVCDTEQMNSVEQMLSLHKDAFKILVINSPDHSSVSRSDLKELCKYIGCVPWDIIIDLDYNSRVDGIHDATAEILRLHKSFHLITYEQTKEITEAEQQNNILRLKAVWILANGCSETKCCQCLAKFGKAKMKITKLLSNIFALSQGPISLLTLVLVQGGEALQAIREVVAGIRDVIEEVDDIVADDASAFLEIHLGNTNAQGLFKNILERQKKDILTTSHRSFACMLGRLYPAPQEKVKFYFPGTSGEAYLTSEDIAPLATSMELYHKDIGKINFEDMEPRQISEIMFEIRSQFHKGNPITPEAIYINSKEQVYVRRNEIRDAKERLENKLKYSRWGQRERQLFIIDHEASGGGTTVATVLLYELKEKYPCVRILKIDECLYQGLQTIYNNSKLVLLLMIDSDDVTESDIKTFSKRLENERIKAQLIVTRRILKFGTGQEEYDPCAKPNDRICVSGTLCREDEMAFINLFKKYRNIQDTHRIFPIGLQAFLKDHSKLESHISMCIRTSKTDQLLVLRLICMIWKYGQTRLSIKIVQAILEIGPNEMYDNITENLGYVSDFLLFSKIGEVKLASTCVVNPILRCVFDSDREVVWINGFISDTAKLIERMHNYSDDLSKLIHHVFIKREKEADGSFIHWSPFIQTMKMQFSKEAIAKELAKIIELLIGTTVRPHMQALLARFFMYELKDPASSMTTIHAALGISKDQTICSCTIEDVHLLTTYGSLYRERVYREKVKGNIPVARTYFEEALAALDMAKQIQQSHARSRFNAVTFIQEARTRVQLLRLYLDIECRGNRRAFTQFLRKSETDELLRTCEGKAQEALDRIDFLRTQDRLHEDSDRLMAAVQTVKFDLLLLHVDFKGKTVLRQIESLPDHIPCDVGSLMRKPDVAMPRRKWEELLDVDIMFIIEEIRKRLTLPTVLRNNYSDIITAMIHIKHRRSKLNHDKYNLDFATECATQWVRRYKNDHQGHFMLGILKFVRAASGKDDEAEEACRCFQTCSKMCTDLKSTPSYRHLRYYVGPGAGLAKLIPHEYYKDGERLQEFRGRQVGRHYVTIKAIPESVKAFISMTDVVSLHEQQPLVKFNLAFSHDGLKAINAEYANDDE